MTARIAVVKLRPLLVLTAAAAAALPAGALADPPPGRVEVINDAGAVVGADIGGNDAIDGALARIRTGALARPDDTRPWRVVVGAGTYGDVVVDEPNLTLLPSAGAAVAITTSVGADHTGGECIDVTRGNVTVQGIACRSARDRGIEVATPPHRGRGGPEPGHGRPRPLRRDRRHRRRRRDDHRLGGDQLGPRRDQPRRS